MKIREPVGRPARDEERTAPKGPAPSGLDRVVMRLLPSLSDMLFICVALGVLLTLQGRLLGEDGDAAWNLRIGSYILSHGIPRVEFMLGPTLGKPTLYYEWLAQVVYALALRLGGLNGVVALAALFVALEVTMLFSALRRRGVPLLLAYPLTLAGAWLTSSTWTARAQHFTLLLTFAWAELLWLYWRTGNRRLLWLFPISAALWANLHGGFVGGLLMLGIAVVLAWALPARQGGARPRALALTFAGSAAATLLNPWGIGLWLHIAGYLHDPVIMSTTREFLSPDFHTLYAQTFLALLVLLAAAWLWLARQRMPESERIALDGAPREREWLGEAAFSPLAIALAALWTLLAMQSVRFVALWALVVLPILGASLTAALRTAHLAEPGQPWGRALIAVIRLAGRLNRRLGRVESLDALISRGVWATAGVVLILLLVLNGGALPGSRTPILNAQFDARTFPVAAAQRLARDGIPAGNGFTTYTWGSYLDYALPAFHPFVDSRSDAYGPRILKQYLDIVGLAPDWSALLDQYRVRWALLPVNMPLAQALALRPGWTCSPADSSGVAVLCQQAPAP